MSTESTMHEVGKIIKKPFVCETIKWKIPYVSSTPLAVDSKLRSPSFFYKDADWYVTLYPYGHSDCQTKSWINVIFERQKSEVLVHKISYRVFFECQAERKSDIFSGSFFFDTNQTQRDLTFYTSWDQIFNNDEKNEPHDAINLVCELQSEKNTEIGKESTKRNLDSCGENAEGKTIINCLRPIGDVIQESFEFECIAWDIPQIFSIPELDKGVQSPLFTFANASWSMKLCLIEKMNIETKNMISVIIERLDSAIEKHPISYKIFFSKKDETKSTLPEYDEPGQLLDISYKRSQVVSGCTVFDSKFTKETVVITAHYNFNFMMFNELCYPDLLICEIRTKKCTAMELNSSGIAIQTAAESPEELNKNKPKTMMAAEAVLPMSCQENPSDNKLYEGIKNLYMKKEHSDVILKVKDQEFPAHKLILAARSSVFASMLLNNSGEEATDVVEIDDCDPTVFSVFLHFLYCGSIENHSEDSAEDLSHMCKLFKIADKYNVQKLRSQCWEFLINQLSPDNFSSIMSLPLQSSEKELIKLSIDLFSSDKEISFH